MDGSKGSQEVALPGGPDPFAQYADAASPQSIEGVLLKFSKGDYLAGENGEEIPLGTEFVADMESLSNGWVLWGPDSKPVERRVGRVAEGFVPPRRTDLSYVNRDEWELDDKGEPRDPWSFESRIVLQHKETQERFTFTTSSRGGIGALGALARVYSRERKRHPGEDPIVALKVDSYDHKIRSYGKIKVPVFQVVGWTPRAGERQLPPPTEPAMDDAIPF
jgi:hypothetical protein